MAFKNLDLQREPTKGSSTFVIGPEATQPTGRRIANRLDTLHSEDRTQCITIELPNDAGKILLESFPRAAYAIGNRDSTLLRIRYPVSTYRWKDAKTAECPEGFSAIGRVAHWPTAESEAREYFSRFLGDLDDDQPEAPAADGKEVFDAYLGRLRTAMNSATHEAAQCVMAIQSLPVPSELRASVIASLLEFVQKNRDINDRYILLAVGAAIRKLLLNLGDEELSIAAELLQTDGRLLIPIEIELEVAKMVVHRLKTTPSMTTAPLAALGSILLENSKLYSCPRMVQRDKHGATALNSLVGVILMRHPDARDLCHSIKKTAPKWFVDSAKSRLRRVIRELEASETEDASTLAASIAVLPILAD